MRIGIDCRLWEQTGVGRYTRNLVENLQKVDKKNDYVLFMRKEDHDAIQNSKFKIQNSKWKIVKTDIKWHSLSEQLKFPTIIRREHLDLMHFPYFSVPIFYNRPYIVTIHDLIINHFSTGKASTLAYPSYLAKREAYEFVIKQAAKGAKKIITPSNATKQEIIDHLKIAENKIDVIYEAAEIKNQESRIKNQEYGKYFLYVGNAYPHKNLERLVQAFKILTRGTIGVNIGATRQSRFSDDARQTLSQSSKSTRSLNESLSSKPVNNDATAFDLPQSGLAHDPSLSNLKLILVGEKDYFYQRLEKENQSDNIIFYGKASDKELVSLYTNAVVLVAPSLMEGFGLPVLEAMSLGCLVVASDIPAFKEIAGDNALYFNPQDENDIYLRLKDVLENEEKYREEKLEKALRKSQQFSWEKAAEQTLNVYESR
ncbi:MAG TPA: glycosyltransferase family 1 protein [Patescibacteria group bacterium]|jgi:glycosyltransferase involved in cell wall biosynthesis|nr:glycosyltransferase family 1 protein [Patescibacteria group bacterium]